MGRDNIIKYLKGKRGQGKREEGESVKRETERESIIKKLERGLK